MKTVVKTLFGSVLYGTNTPSSDVDYKEIFIPNAKDIVLGTVKNNFSMNTSDNTVKNTADDVDHEYFSLQYFLKLAIKGETIALDMIHTPDRLIVGQDPTMQYVWNFIKENRSKLYTTDMKAYLGYVKKQAAKYGIKGTRMAALREVLNVVDTLPLEYHKTMEEASAEAFTPGGPKHISMTRSTKVYEFLDKLPSNNYAFLEVDEQGNTFYNVLGSKHQSTIRVLELKQKLHRVWNQFGERARQAELNEGIDWKSLSHALRGGYQLKEIYQTGDLKYPLKDAKLLREVKEGKHDFKYVSSLLEDLIHTVDNEAFIAKKNGMPEQVDTTMWDQFVHDVYLEQIKLEYNLRTLP